MPKAGTLLNDVLTKATRTQPGYKSWFERLPPDARAELAEVREQFHASGSMQKKAFARAVIEAARERGWETSGIQGVVAWLNAGG